MQNIEDNDEILNNNLMFKLLNREKRIKELEQINYNLKKEFETEFDSNPRVKHLKQEIGALQAYIDELEDEKLNKIDKEIETCLKDLTKSNKQLKENNKKLQKSNEQLIEKICKNNLQL